MEKAHHAPYSCHSGPELFSGRLLLSLQGHLLRTLKDQDPQGATKHWAPSVPAALKPQVSSKQKREKCPPLQLWVLFDYQGTEQPIWWPESQKSLKETTSENCQRPSQFKVRLCYRDWGRKEFFLSSAHLQGDQALGFHPKPGSELPCRASQKTAVGVSALCSPVGKPPTASSHVAPRAFLPGYGQTDLGRLLTQTGFVHHSLSLKPGKQMMMMVSPPSSSLSVASVRKSFKVAREALWFSVHGCELRA